MFVLSGKKRSGKDTVAGFMKSYGMKTYALADPIKAALLHGFNEAKNVGFVTNDMLYGLNDYDREQPLNMTVYEVRETLIEAVFYAFRDADYDLLQQAALLETICNKLLEVNSETAKDFSIRKFMTYFGTDIMCYIVDRMFWVNLCEKKAPSDAVITDVRQPWEEEYFREKNAKFIFVIGKYKDYVEPPVTHITEQGLTPRDGDIIIINDSTIENLEGKIKCLLN